MMTEAQMSYLRELAEAATPGERMPLVYAYATMDEMVEECSQALRNRPDGTKVHFVWAPSIGEFVAMTGNGPKAEANAAFAAAMSPEVVVAMLEKIERLEAERDARPEITPNISDLLATMLEVERACRDEGESHPLWWDIAIPALRAHAAKAVSR